MTLMSETILKNYSNIREHNIFIPERPPIGVTLSGMSQSLGEELMDTFTKILDINNLEPEPVLINYSIVSKNGMYHKDWSVGFRNMKVVHCINTPEKHEMTLISADNVTPYTIIFKENMNKVYVYDYINDIMENCMLAHNPVVYIKENGRRLKERRVTWRKHLGSELIEDLEEIEEIERQKEKEVLNRATLSLIQDLGSIKDQERLTGLILQEFAREQDADSRRRHAYEIAQRKL